MINQLPQGSAREDFLEQLNDFYAACGRPRYKEVAEISERLDDLYPLEGDRRRDLPTLSPSGISEVLGGRRKNLPSAGWLAAFVLSCQRRAWELGALDKDPGVATLPDWQRRLTQALGRGNSAGTKQSGGPPPAGQPVISQPPTQPSIGPPPAGPPPPDASATRSPRPRPDDRDTGQADDEPPEPPPGPSARLDAGGGNVHRIGGGGRVRARDGAAPGRVAARTVGRGGGAQLRSVVGLAAVSVPAVDEDVARSAIPVRLPAALREYVAGYGTYGSGLLADAQAGAVDAVYRLAVLLLGAESVDGDAEAQRLLIYAGAGDHREALHLLAANPVRLDRLDAASHAYELAEAEAEAAAAGGHWAAALAFYECAARCGLPAASVKLADRLLVQGEDGQAVRWLEIAAQQGDVRAEIRLERLRRAAG
ncbi:MAG TPA: hypothetical protein VFU43_06510 [Streptosporangiaceae bacterium]|nr:hypothetical protein [Streptosporangiaceae bacterium]